jgi:molybdopterin molybdotransferase
VSQKELPAFNISAMDGFAVRASDTLLATPANPLTLSVSHRIEAGALRTAHEVGECVEITTGAVVPEAFDAVIPYEQVNDIECSHGALKSIKLTVSAIAHQNIRRKGEDFQVGSSLIEPSTIIRASHIAAMAAIGTRKIDVYPTLSVDIFSTGAEVRPLRERMDPLHFGEIYDSNTPYLLNELKASGIKARHAGSVGDDPVTFTESLLKPSQASIVISTGGVSKGPRDFIAQTLASLGARILFHGVSIKPGKPVLFAVLHDGRYFFGLPGNPIATAIGLRFFVQPLIRELLGMPAEVPTKALFSGHYLKKGDGLHVVKVHRVYDQYGVGRITMLKDQSAFSVSSLLAMNCWAIVPETVRCLETDMPVDCFDMKLF